MRALQRYRPETAESLNQLANVLLRDPSTLSPGERELIGAFVSSRNDCYYCQAIHGAVAAHHFGGNEELVAQATSRRRKSSPDEKNERATRDRGECLARQGYPSSANRPAQP